MSEELKRHKEALDVAMQGLRDMGLDFAWHYETVAAKINAILHPEPEYEEVTVERWAVVPPSGAISVISYDSQETAEKSRVMLGGGEIIKLTGTLRRPKPAKVVRSETIEGVHLGYKGRCYRDDTHECAGFSAPANTKGTLTFTWTE